MKLSCLGQNRFYDSAPRPPPPRPSCRERRSERVGRGKRTRTATAAAAPVSPSGRMEDRARSGGGRANFLSPDNKDGNGGGKTPAPDQKNGKEFEIKIAIAFRIVMKGMRQREAADIR